MQSQSLQFARTVQALAATARSLGLTAPGFRTPPRLVGVHRSIKRRPTGSTVAVVVRDRPWAAVQADLVEGVVAANGLVPPVADRVRAELWAAITGPAVAEAGPGVAAARRGSGSDSERAHEGGAGDAAVAERRRSGEAA